MKRHLISCQPASDPEENADPLEFDICYCCSEPLDTAHKVGDFPCSNCDKLFVTEDAVNRHDAIIHSDDLTCPDCNRKCESRQEFEHHVVQHSKKPFSCLKCKKVFASKVVLERHLTQSKCTKREWKCQVSDKCFN